MRKLFVGMIVDSSCRVSLEGIISDGAPDTRTERRVGGYF